MNETSKIYIDIQSLLDMRQSQLVQVLGREEALAYVTSEQYYLRDTDVFAVDQKAWKDLTEAQDERALKDATLSYMIVPITRHLSQMEKLNAFNGETASAELVINTYPYKFSQSTADGFRNAVFIKLGIPVLITLVCESLEALSPSFIKHSGIRQFYCYSAAAWMRLHAQDIVAGALRETRLFFPALGEKALEKEELKEIQKLGFNDIFCYTEYLFANYTRVQFLPVVFYSNLVTATAVLGKFDEELRATPLGEEEATESPKE